MLFRKKLKKKRISSKFSYKKYGHFLSQNAFKQ
jgi:hypothetical protein